MKEDLRHDVLQRLQSDFGLKHRTGTDYMRGGTCPKCKKKELYSRFDTPWMVICGRPEKCGHTLHVKELYDDLFEDWSKRAPATDQHPNATARAYLSSPGAFALSLSKGGSPRKRSIPLNTTPAAPLCGSPWRKAAGGNA